jgi:NAD+-dependent protein deacetylase SIR2
MITTLDLAAASSDPVARRTLASLSLSVAKSKRIVVVTGAGISCSCGIPVRCPIHAVHSLNLTTHLRTQDFRSSDGLYALVKKQYPDTILKGRDLFDASLFRDPTTTSIFYSFISQLKQSIDLASPSRTHHFIRTLDEKKKLLRSYTQNIDGLEEKAGLIGSSSQEVKADGKGKGKIRARDVRNVQLHGDIHRVRCTLCSADLPCKEEYLQLFAVGLAPECPECTSRCMFFVLLLSNVLPRGDLLSVEARLARSARPLRIGTLRPGIVLYDEAHPLGDDIGDIQASDVSRKPDMLIIMGTSLKVHGLRKLVKDFAKAVHASAPPDHLSAKKSWMGKVIFVNKTPPGSEWNGVIDYHVEGETDDWAHKVEEDWRMVRPSDWEVQQTLDNDDNSAFKAVKDVVGKGIRKYLSLSYFHYLREC